MMIETFILKRNILDRIMLNGGMMKIAEFSLDSFYAKNPRLLNFPSDLSANFKVQDNYEIERNQDKERQLLALKCPKR